VVYSPNVYSIRVGGVADEEIVLSARILAGSQIAESDEHGSFHSYCQI